MCMVDTTFSEKVYENKRENVNKETLFRQGPSEKAKLPECEIVISIYMNLPSSSPLRSISKDCQFCL